MQSYESDARMVSGVEAVSEADQPAEPAPGARKPWAKLRFRSWDISAPFYRWTYIDVAHQLDEDLFAYLGPRVQGAVVADCGCGPGVVTEKFLNHGAARVMAIDVNAGMLRQVEDRLAQAVANGQVTPVHQPVTAALFPNLSEQFLEGDGFDVVLFKRSLYVKREQARAILSAVMAQLNTGGVLAVVHGERSLRRYAFKDGWKPTRYTPYHLFNRLISKVSEKLRINQYTLYTQEELLTLLAEVALGHQVETIPSAQRAYNLAAVLA